MKVCTESPTEEGADRQSGLLSEQVQAGHIDRRFHVGGAFERRVHDSVELIDLQWILADELGSKFCQAGSHPGGIGWEVGRTKRARLTPADQSGIGNDGDDRRVEDIDRFAAAPFVGDLVQWQVDLVDAYLFDFHGWYSVVSADFLCRQIFASGFKRVIVQDN